MWGSVDEYIKRDLFRLSWINNPLAKVESADFFDYFVSDFYLYIGLNGLFVLVFLHLCFSYVTQNILRILFFLETIILISSFIFLVIGLHYGDIYGQIVVLHLLTIAAVEAAVGLALIYSYYRLWRTIKIGSLSKIKG